jgi:hypothetical protein
MVNLEINLLIVSVAFANNFPFVFQYLTRCIVDDIKVVSTGCVAIITDFRKFKK